MAALRAQLEKSFSEADVDKSGVITTAELESLLKKLDPSWKSDEIALILSKIEKSDDKVKFSAFIDYFCPKPSNAPVLHKELSRTLSTEEQETVTAAFKKFDKDGSNTIDLNEIKAMCAEAGKKITDDQASAAMAQLDKNGDGTVSFDEFLLWWTCSPGLGGYNHVALGFLKSKLAVKTNVSKAISRVARKRLENTDEFVLNVNTDISPNMAGCENKMSWTLSLRKPEDGNDGAPRFTMVVSTKNPDAAASTVAACEKVIAKISAESGPPPVPISFKQEKDKVRFSIEATPDMIDAEMTSAIGFMQEAVKKMEIKLGGGVTVEDVMANPSRPLVYHFKGTSLVAEAVLGLSALAAFMPTELPPEAEAALKVLGGMNMSMKFGYNEPNIMAVARQFQNMFLFDPDTGSDEIKGSKIITKGIDYARSVLYSQLVENGGIVDGKWPADAPKDVADAMIGAVRDMGTGITGIDSITIDRLPGSTVEFHVKFERINPFPLLNYFFGHLPRGPPDAGPNLSKPISVEEDGRLRDVFKQFDKDGSGQIDVKELTDMVSALGGKCEEYEIQEAMSLLDYNGDGTCNFDEFKDWWSSKPGCGGYNGFALRFLKAKVKMQEMLGKGVGNLAKASGYLGIGEVTQDTVLRIQQDVTPAMDECEPKMSLTASLPQSGGEATGPPSLTLKLGAKSAAVAEEVVSKCKELISPFEDTFMMMGVPAPVFQSSGSTVTVCVSAPEEAVEAMYSEADAMKVLIPMIRSIAKTKCKIEFANTFDDFLAAPDKPIPDIFAGARLVGNLAVSALGKKLFFDAILPIAGSGMDYEAGKLGIEFAKLFYGADVTYLFGYHKENLSKLMSVIPEDMKGMSTIDGLRAFISGAIPIDEDAAEFMAPMAHAALELLGKMDSLDSLLVENVTLKKEFSGDGSSGIAGLQLDFQNVKPYGLIHYFIEPIVSRFPKP